MNKFKIGDKVKWISQAGGHYKTKVGIVVAIVDADSSADLFLPDNFWFNGPPDLPARRNHKSYLIQVGNSKLLYWPRVKHLERVK